MNKLKYILKMKRTISSFDNTKVVSYYSNLSTKFSNELNNYKKRNDFTLNFSTKRMKI